jgi:hypothetical protein
MHTVEGKEISRIVGLMSSFDLPEYLLTMTAFLIGQRFDVLDWHMYT